MPATKKTGVSKATKRTSKKEVNTTEKVKKEVKVVTEKEVSKETFVYMFFNCDENKNFSSMNVRYNNEVFEDSKAGRKALWEKVKTEIETGKIHVEDEKSVKQDIMKGEPDEATPKMKYGDIEKLIMRK